MRTLFEFYFLYIYIYIILSYPQVQSLFHGLVGGEVEGAELSSAGPKGKVGMNGNGGNFGREGNGRKLGVKLPSTACTGLDVNTGSWKVIGNVSNIEFEGGVSLLPAEVSELNCNVDGKRRRPETEEEKMKMERVRVEDRVNKWTMRGEEEAIEL